jgi:glycosyltransferase involved in cell wall biosynthesis
MRLSVALIARDEETMLPGCLESIKDADEIVVVDTGSTDGTVEIARQYTDEVFEIEWRDNFAAARNYAKALCTGDWIYSIDADHINETPVSEIKSEIERIAGHSVASVLINNHHKAAWLWKNDPDILWEGRVHEVLNQPATIETAVAQSIRPRGYANTKRNISLLQKEDDSPRTRFYLGREYFELGDYRKAIDWLDHYLKAPAFLAEHAEAWLTKAKAHWFLNEGNKARAACLQAIGINPDFTEALTFMAEMTYEPWRSKWTYIAENAQNRDVLFDRTAKIVT